MDKNGRAVKLAKDTLDEIGNFGFDNEAYAETICRGHRTLQQNWMRMSLKTIAKMAEAGDKGLYDDRNESAVKMAQKEEPWKAYYNVLKNIEIYSTLVKT